MYIVNKSDTTYIVGDVMVKGETVQYVADTDAAHFLADAVVEKQMELGWIVTLPAKPDPSEYLSFTIIDEFGQTEGYGVCYRCGSFTRLQDGHAVNSGGGRNIRRKRLLLFRYVGNRRPRFRVHRNRFLVNTIRR